MAAQLAVDSFSGIGRPRRAHVRARLGRREILVAMPPTGKQRASRIPLDYFARPDWLERGKLRWAALALVLPIGWLASGLLRSDQGQLRYSRGPVAAVHAAWEDKCTVCHVPFQPITGE